jgi:excisionase family DNA binding protein
VFDSYSDVLTPIDLQRALNIGRTTAYKILNSGQLRHIRIGTAIKIPKICLIDFIENSCYNDPVVTDSPSMKEVCV